MGLFPFQLCQLVNVFQGPTKRLGHTVNLGEHNRKSRVKVEPKMAKFDLALALLPCTPYLPIA